MNLTDEGLRLLAASTIADGPRGHSHFWERAMSRRQFIGTSAAASGAALSSPLWAPLLAEANDLVEPKPIPQTVAPGAPFHIVLPGPQSEPSTITDFRGMVGVADLVGTGWGTDTNTGARTHLFTAIDNRFMKGTYVGVDGKKHQATFGFV
jgi:hypothetical protein